MAPRHDDEDSSRASSSSEAEEGQIESLVAGRQRRSTAGTRMNALIADEEEAEDDDLKLLFAETGEDGEEDVEFDEASPSAEGSDEDMGSSSDEDQGPAAGADDLEGEREIERAAKEEKRKKRRAQEAFTKRPRAKAKIASTAEGHPEAGATMASETTAPRPKKKSERVSWLPTPEEGPVRQSSRKQTMQNKQVVHERMRESEKRRRQQIRVMEAAAKKKEAERPKAMTQEDRLAEAAKAEAKNAKSLNRWEAAEEKRVQEQRAKIAALKDRKLEGPVISFWSGPAKWEDGRLVSTGRKVLQEVGKEKVQAGAEPEEPADTVMVDAQASEVKDSTPDLPTESPAFAAHGEGNMLIDGAPFQSAAAATGESQADSQHHHQPDGSHTQRDGYIPPVPNIHLPDIPSASILPPTPEITSRNVVILEKIDANASKLPQLQDHVLLRKKGQARPPRPTQEICTITGEKARFRDPKTGMGYANSKAYAELQKLASGSAQWSTLLGCYVGSTSTAAEGVPTLFLAAGR